MKTSVYKSKNVEQSRHKTTFFGSKPKTSFFSPAIIQPKLTIGSPNDMYEHEADAIADHVMQMQQPSVQLKSLPITSLQRQCAHCEEEEKKMQLKEMNGTKASADSHLESYVGSLNNGGKFLTDEVRSFYEPRFGYDFSQVKVHTDSVAAKSAQSINALAYTSGNNIVFNSGQYSPESDTGKRLLGHELTHVVQQQHALQPKLLQLSELTDDEIDIEAFENGLEDEETLVDSNISQMVQTKPKSGGGCPQGKQDEMIRNDCNLSEKPANTNKFITSLHVKLSSQNLHVAWSDGTANDWLSSPNPSHTPVGDDVVGVKCSVNHTNLKKDGMAWFTSFASQGLRIGFHNSQRVGNGIKSHGCVRVSCDHAKIINQNSWKGKTKIKVD